MSRQYRMSDDFRAYAEASYAVENARENPNQATIVFARLKTERLGKRGAPAHYNTLVGELSERLAEIRVDFRGVRAA